MNNHIPRLLQNVLKISYLVIVLIYLFNPVVVSLSQQSSNLPIVPEPVDKSYFSGSPEQIRMYIIQQRRRIAKIKRDLERLKCSGERKNDLKKLDDEKFL